jgi:hypothetical protein
VSTKYKRTPERWTLGSTIEEKNTSCIQTAERRAETTCFGVAFTCVETKTFVLFESVAEMLCSGATID